MPQLSYTTFDGVQHISELKSGITRVGRTPNNDLQIDELEISSQHCEIRCQEDSMIIKDLESAGGTFVDGQPIRESTVIPGQIISLGTFLITVNASEGTRSADTRQELKPAQLADGSYSCLRHQDTRAQYECESCFDLACEQCVHVVTQSDPSSKATCKCCGSDTRLIDWSGLDRTKKDVMADLFIPEKVKHTVDLWKKHKDRFQSKKQ